MRGHCVRTFRVILAVAPLSAINVTSIYAQHVRDSAGITIVENARPTWSAAEVLRLAGSPVLVIGTRVEAPYELSRVAGTVQLTDGRIVIADGASLELRFFDATGTFIRSVGRSGDGPGEFRRMERLVRLPGDTLAVVSMFATISYFTSDGEFVHREVAAAMPRDGTMGIPITPVVLRGRAFVRGVMIQGRTARGARWIDSIHWFWSVAIQYTSGASRPG